MPNQFQRFWTILTGHRAAPETGTAIVITRATPRTSSDFGSGTAVEYRLNECVISGLKAGRLTVAPQDDTGVSLLMLTHGEVAEIVAPDTRHWSLQDIGGLRNITTPALDRLDSFTVENCPDLQSAGDLELVPLLTPYQTVHILTDRTTYLMDRVKGDAPTIVRALAARVVDDRQHLAGLASHRQEILADFARQARFGVSAHQPTLDDLLESEAELAQEATEAMALLEAAERVFGLNAADLGYVPPLTGLAAQPSRRKKSPESK